MIKRRLVAYIYDICILTLLLVLTNLIMPKNDNTEKLTNEIKTIEKEVIEREISYEQFFNQYIDINHQLDKENVAYTIINVIYIIIFFVIIPIKNNNMTLGQRKMAIKFSSYDGKINTNDLIYRSFILNGLFHMIVSLLILYLVPSSTYFYVTIVLSFIQLMLVIISGFMILYRHDEKGLQDLWTKTYIEEVK